MARLKNHKNLIYVTILINKMYSTQYYDYPFIICITFYKSQGERGYKNYIYINVYIYISRREYK